MGKIKRMKAEMVGNESMIVTTWVFKSLRNEVEAWL